MGGRGAQRPVDRSHENSRQRWFISGDAVPGGGVVCVCLCRVGVGGGVEAKANSNWERPGGCDEWRTTSDERRATSGERRPGGGAGVVTRFRPVVVVCPTRIPLGFSTGTSGISRGRTAAEQPRRETRWCGVNATRRRGVFVGTNNTWKRQRRVTTPPSGRRRSNCLPRAVDRRPHTVSSSHSKWPLPSALPHRAVPPRPDPVCLATNGR